MNAVKSAVNSAKGHVSSNKSTILETGDWVLLSGASGFVGAHILNAALAAGYRVKCTVRSEQKADEIRKLRPQDVGNLEFAIVKDVAADGAFDEAVKGVVGVLHSASPFVTEGIKDNKAELLDPAIKGTTGILESIVKFNPDVKRVVITSSFASIVDPMKGVWPEKTYSEEDWNPVTYDEAVATDSGLVAYCASKKLAEKAAWDFIKERQPNFTLSTICPPMVYGPAIHSISSLSSLNTSSADIYRLINGSLTTVPDTAIPAWVDVRDVGKAHILALERANAANQRYLITAGNFYYRDICGIIKKRYPELVEQGKTPDVGREEKENPKVFGLDNAKSRHELGLEYLSLEQSVADMVEVFRRLERQ